MRAVVMAGVVGGLLAVASAAHADEARGPTAGEQKAFDAWYRARATSQAAAAAPQLETRRDGKRWRLSAHEDGPAVRAVLPLCRVPRTIFERNRAKAWTERAETWLWVHHTPQCGAAPASAVQLRSELPEIDILRLIQAQNELLQSARLLMAGNTSCAPNRSRNFRLVGLDKARDGLPALVFESDIGSIAQVSVRKSRADLTAWNVNCQ